MRISGLMTRICTTLPVMRTWTASPIFCMARVWDAEVEILIHQANVVLLQKVVVLAHRTLLHPIPRLVHRHHRRHQMMRMKRSVSPSSMQKSRKSTRSG